MSEEEQKMIWTIGLNDHISGGLEEIIGQAEALRNKIESSFKSLNSAADVLDAALDNVGKTLQALGQSEEQQSSTLAAMEESIKEFASGSTSAKEVLTSFASSLKEDGVAGREFVEVMANLSAALGALYRPVAGTVDVVNDLIGKFGEIGIPTEAWAKDLRQLERQIDEFVRTGEGAEALLASSQSLFEQMTSNSEQADGLSESIKKLVAAKKDEANASQRAAKAEAEHRAELEKMKAASEQEHKNYLLQISKRNKAHKEAAMSSRSVISAYTRLLSMFGLMPPGAAEFLYTLNSMTSMMEMCGGRANTLTKILEALLRKLLLGFKSVLMMGGGLGAALLAPLAAIGAVLAVKMRELSDARETLKKTLEESNRIAERYTNALSKQFEEEARAAEDATRRINDAAKAYENLAKSKEAVAQANSAKIVQDIEDERRAWHDANGGASAEDKAAANASFDYEIAQRKAQDLARQQQMEVDLERNEDRRRNVQRSKDEAYLDELIQREQQAKDDASGFRGKAPSRLDIRTEGTFGTNYVYENEEEYIKAAREYRRVLKQKENLAENIAKERRRVEERLAKADKEDEVVANNRAASATNRDTAKRRSDAELAKQSDALDRAIYAADTAAQKKSDDQYLALYGLSAASDRATKARKTAEEKLAASTDEQEKAALRFAVKEKKIDEDVAKAKEKLERERYALLAQATDTLERDRINAEYDYQRTWADLLAQRQREELAEEQALHRQRIDDARKERDERVNALSGERQDAVARLDAAKRQTATAWGWYRDKKSLAGQIKEWEADSKARDQYEKDLHSLTHGTKSSLYSEAKYLQRHGHEDKMEERISEWRRKKMLSLNDEATLRVALAQDEEKNAQSAVINIDRTLQRIEDKFEKVMTMEG